MVVFEKESAEEASGFEVCFYAEEVQDENKEPDKQI